MKGDECDRLLLAFDMNFDGVFTISDVGGWLHYFYFFPAKVLSAMAYNSHLLRDFFEMGCSTGSGWGGAVISIVAWAIFLGSLGAMVDGASKS